jgi:prevent-host-death family protein
MSEQTNIPPASGFPAKQSAGISDIRNHLSAYVRQVERTREPVTIHVQGRPVAALAPVTPAGAVDLPGASSVEFGNQCRSSSFKIPEGAKGGRSPECMKPEGSP